MCLCVALVFIHSPIRSIPNSILIDFFISKSTMYPIFRLCVIMSLPSTVARSIYASTAYECLSVSVRLRKPWSKSTNQARKWKVNGTIYQKEYQKQPNKNVSFIPCLCIECQGCTMNPRRCLATSLSIPSGVLKSRRVDEIRFKVFVTAPQIEELWFPSKFFFSVPKFNFVWLLL